MKLYSRIALIVLTSTIFSSCLKEANYPPYPVITFQSFTPVDTNSAILKINFTDGNGDIGTPSGDNTAPPNFYIEFLRDSAHNGIFLPYFIDGPAPSPITGDTAIYGYNIPDITPTGKDKELSGQIQIAMSYPWYLQNNMRMEYVVWIVDRAGHASNRIVTPVFLSPP